MERRKPHLEKKTEKVPTAFLRRQKRPGRRHRLFGNVSPEKLKRIKAWIVLIALIGILTGGGYLIFFAKTFTVSEILVNKDGTLIEHPELTAKLGGFRGQKLFFLKTDEAIQNILESYPEIADVELDTDLPDTLVAHLTTYPQAANIVNDYKGGTKKFIINLNGLIIAEDNEDLSLPYIRIATKKPPAIKTHILTKEQVYFMSNASKRFNELFDMEIKEIIYKKIEREAHLKTARDFLVWLDMEKDMETQLGKLKTVIPKLNIYQEELEYIDLRISGVSGEKVIYK